jgi:hypothetical protein
LGTVITAENRALGEFAHDPVAADILDKLVDKILGFDRAQVEVDVRAANHQATVSAKADSTLYTGSVIVTFTVAPVTNLRDLAVDLTN